MKEQIELGRQRKAKMPTEKKVFLVLLIVLLVTIIALVLVIVFKKEKANNDTYFNVDLYGYYTSTKEDSKVKGFYEKKAEFLGTIAVKENDTVIKTLKDYVEECNKNSGDCTIADDFKAYLYTDKVETVISKDNTEHKTVQKCKAKAKNKKAKAKCKTSYNFINELEQYDLEQKVTSNLELLINKDSFKY